MPVLLRPAADSPQWNGLLQRGLPGEAPVSILRYEVVRVWQIPAERLLAGGIGTLALAPISAVPQGEVRQVIRRMKERLGGPRAPRRAADIWAATYVLLGLRYTEDFAHALFEEVLGMEESVTYQAIVRRGREEGRAEEARRILLQLGGLRFGAPDAATRATVEAIGDLPRLEALTARVLSASSWDELLAPPRRRNGRRAPRG